MFEIIWPSAEGQWLRIGAMLIASVPLAHLCELSGNKTGAEPLLANAIAPMSFYLSLYELGLTTLLFRKMHRGSTKAAGN